LKSRAGLSRVFKKNLIILIVKCGATSIPSYTGICDSECASTGGAKVLRSESCPGRIVNDFSGSISCVIDIVANIEIVCRVGWVKRNLDIDLV